MITAIIKRVNLSNVDLGDEIMVESTDDPREVDFLQVFEDISDGVLIGFTDGSTAVVGFGSEVFVEVED